MTTERGELAGKVALVTGGAKNIGRAISLELAAAGAAVAVNTRHSIEDGERVVQEIRSAGGQCELYAADIGSAAAAMMVTAAVLDMNSRRPRRDVLNASIMVMSPWRLSANCARNRLTAQESWRPNGMRLDWSWPQLVGPAGGCRKSALTESVASAMLLTA